MSSTTQPPLPWFRRHRLAVLGWGGIALLLLLLLAFGQLQRHLTQRKIDTKLAAIRAQGLPTTLAELNAFYLSVPASENAALLVIQAQNTMVDWDYDTPWIGETASNSVLYVTNPITPAAITALAEIVRSNQNSLQLLHASATNSRSRYLVDFTQGASSWLSYLAPVKRMIHLLRLEAFHHLSAGRKSEALRSVAISFQTADTLSHEPLMISYLVRNACLAVSCGTLEKLLQRSEFSPADLLRLEEVLTISEARTDVRRMLQGERAFICGSWQEPVSKYYTNAFFAPSTPFDTWPQPLQVYAWRVYEQSGYKEADLLNFLGVSDELLDAASLSPSEAISAAQNIEQRLSAPAKPSLDMISTCYSISILGPVFKRHASIKAHFRTAQTALAIERFRMENQRLPQSLGELIPQYLSSSPLDPFTEAPLLYRITATGFRVYSVGENALDDGGLTRDEALSVQKKSDDILFTVERLKAP